MGFDCPHCSKEIPDVVPHSRLREKAEAVRAADVKIADLEAKLASLPDLERRAGEAAQLQTELLLSRAGVQDPKTCRRIVAAYRADSEGIEKPPTLSDWLAGDGADLLARFQAPAPPPAPAPAAGATAQPPPPAPATGLPRDPSGGAPAVPRAPGLTAEQFAPLQAKILSEYPRASAERRKELAKELDDLKARALPPTA